MASERDDLERECPICGRVWTMTFYDDCLVPACGCYGDSTEAYRVPCEPCGMAHALQCPLIPGRLAP
jgi:hypothetical protein